MVFLYFYLKLKSVFFYNFFNTAVFENNKNNNNLSTVVEIKVEISAAVY